MQQTALVVDDSKSARFAMRKLLEARGFAVHTAESATEAYAYLMRRRPDIVFLDHLMPGTDGIDALRAMRREPSLAGMPIIICSSNDGVGFIAQARAIGATDVLVKPPSHDHISAVLQQMAIPKAGLPPQPTTGTSTKVTAIREPAIAIEQAVMKSLREAMPETARSRHGLDFNPPKTVVPISAVPWSPPPVDCLPTAPSIESQPVSFAESASGFRRDEIESQMRRMTQDLHAQFSSLSARMAHLEAAIRHIDTRETNVEAIAAAATTRANESLVTSMRTLTAQMESQFTNFQLSLENYQRRAVEAEESIRESAINEAHAVAERIVMDAAARISEQIAESLLRVLKPAAANSSGSAAS